MAPPGLAGVEEAELLRVTLAATAEDAEGALRKMEEAGLRRWDGLEVLIADSLWPFAQIAVLGLQCKTSPSLIDCMQLADMTCSCCTPAIRHMQGTKKACKKATETAKPVTPSLLQASAKQTVLDGTYQCFFFRADPLVSLQGIAKGNLVLLVFHSTLGKEVVQLWVLPFYWTRVLRFMFCHWIHMKPYMGNCQSS